MIKASDFTEYLNEMVKCGSIYLWGGQGEFVGNLKVGQIIANETSVKNAARVMRTIGAMLDAGKPYEKMRAFDCSGLGSNFFQKNGLIKGDITADGLYKMCKKIKKSEIKEGDMVFIVAASGKATHVGYCIGNNKIVEAAGRDLGVVCRDVSKNTWTNAGRPPFWVTEEQEVRELRLTSPMMKGEDVKELQQALKNHKYDCGSVDGTFGKKTETAVINFQFNNGLTADGIVGEKTRKALGI